ncbi:MAG: EAL domain-containing protein [Treponema sp.]|nr:EAL domain-containing protein [Treponema sp.]
MNKRQKLLFFRNFSITLGFICLLASTIFLIRFVSTEIKPKEEVNVPVEVSHKVLFFCSYSPLYFTYESQIQGLQEALYPKGTEYDIIFLDSEQRGKADFSMLATYVKSKLDGKKYEAVLLGDNAALRFALEYQSQLFPNLPMVFFGVTDFELALKACATPMITGYYESNYLEETMNLAMKLFPNRKTFVALHDQSSSGQSDIASLWSFRKKYKDYAFIDLDATLLSQEELIFLLDSLPADSILLYMTCYTDKYGKNYSMLSRTNTIVQHTNVPIFRNYIGGEGMGILGGISLDVEEQCRLAGETTAKIVSGADISEFPFVEQTPSRTAFDYNLIKQYNLKISDFPPDTIFYNKPDNFLNHYGNILPAVGLIILTLVFFVLAANFGKAISKKLVLDLQKSNDALVESEETLRYQAEYDEVLDILNRRTITEWLHENLTPEDTYSILIIDIDNFKMLNDSYGHSLADSILQYLVALLKGMALERGWMMGRFGGDEFLIYIPNEILTIDCETTKNILELIRAPIPLGDETLSLTVSLGASCSDGETPPELHINNTEGALYEAKARGKNGIVIYDDIMKKKTLEEIVIKEKLQRAFDSDGFFMLYQPQINAKTKKVAGYEALVRMKEPGVYPGQFIPVAEKSGWIWRIGRITTELVIKQLAAWRDAGEELHPVSVNFSSNQLNDHGYVDFIEELLKKYDIPPHYLEIEITEGLFLEKSSLADTIFKRFKDLGIRLHMDDFGTGYSSLGYLTYIPVDIIKLDKSLVDAYLVEGKDSFIKNIIHLMHDLGKAMIIEGVEEKYQYERLCEFGADTIQGYYFSKPIPADEAIKFEVKE